MENNPNRISSENGQDNPWESLSSHDGESFEVGIGISKEAEFKRITGEDWPGKTYYAESSGSDSGDDGVFETWTIHKRPTAEADNAEPAPATESAPAEADPTTSSAYKPDEVNYDSGQGTGGSMANAVFDRLIRSAQQDQQPATKPSDDDLAAYNRWQDERSGKSNNGDSYVHGRSSGPTFAEMDFSRARDVRDKVITDEEGKVIGVDKDGSKTRSYTDWDIYNRQKGETMPEFGSRARSRHEAERRYQEREKLIQQAMRAYYEGKYDRKARDERIKRIMEMPLKPKKDSHEVTDNEHNNNNNGDNNSARLEQDDSKPNPNDLTPEATNLEESTPENSEDTGIEIPEKLNKRFSEEKGRRLKDLESKLSELRPKLAELYARNRRLFVGSRNRIAFEDARREYRRMLDEYLKLQAERANDEERGKVKPTEEDAKKAKEDANAKLEEFKKKHPDASAEEIEAEKQRLQTEATNKLFDLDGIKTRTNARFLSEYLKQQNALEVATTEALDNGTVLRRLVHNVIDNRYVKTALAVAGAAGIAAGAAALIASGGALAIGLGWTASGVAMGAGRGALSGLIMSRQDSKNSAVRRLMTDEERMQAIERISISENGNADVSNVAGFLMDRYNEAKSVDRSNNAKRTAISAGIGAIIGGVMSGVHVNKTITTETTEQGIVGYEPGQTETHSAVDIDSISHAKGKGTEKLFLELGGESSDSYYSTDAHQIVLDVGKRWGLTEGKSSWTFPGKISEWPAQAQGFAREVSEEWAKRGLIPSTTTFTPGEAIYGPITTATTEILRDSLFENVVQGISAVGAGIFGSTFGNLGGNRRPLRSQGETADGMAEENIDELFRVPGDDVVEQTEQVASPAEMDEGTPEVAEAPSTEASNNTSEQSGESAEAKLRLATFATEQGLEDNAGAIFAALSDEIRPEEAEEYSNNASQLLNSLSDEQLGALLTFFSSPENAGAFTNSAFYNYLKTTAYGVAL